MKFDLGQLPASMITPLLIWCFANDVDRVNVVRILESFLEIPTVEGEIDLSLNVTEEQATWIILRWG